MKNHTQLLKIYFLCVAIIFPLICSSKPILLIAGPGGFAYGPQEISNFKQQLVSPLDNDQIYVIGDGNKEISIAEVTDQMTFFGQKHERFDVIIMAHGLSNKLGHSINLGHTWEKTSKLFSSIAQVQNNRPVNILMISCYAEASTIDAKAELPKGSIIFALSKKNEPVHYADIDRFMSAMSTNPIHSVVDLFKLYLVKGLQNRVSPTIQFIGQHSIILDHLLQSRIGSTIFSDTQDKIKLRLQQLMDASEIDYFINKLKTSRSVYDIYADEYGRALAVSLFASRLSTIIQ
ncbi:MAG: hypothetical protein ISR65_09040 [Bacteriovoracaceae bacterium]|nr:hypothetical protein [Bacteriovoracaceae bacterium]